MIDLGGAWQSFILSAQEGLAGPSLTDTEGVGSAGIGAVSELMAAALQTAGVYAQASILQNFREALTALAGLCYLVSVCLAVSSVAIYGSYRRAPYLLIGPALFYYVILTTASVNGTTVRVGTRTVPGSVQDQIRFLREWVHNERYEQDAQVSRLFLIVDNLVSAVVQDVVAVIVDSGRSEDMVLKARERVFSWILLSTPADPSVIRLVSVGVMGWCGQVNNLALEIPTHRIDPAQGIEDANLTEVGRRVKRDYEERRQRRNITLDSRLLELLYGEVGEQWRDYVFNCEEIWEETRVVIRDFADRQLDINRFLRGGGFDPNVPWDEVQQQVHDTLAGPNRQNPAVVLSAIILRNLIGKTSHSAMLSQITEHAQFNSARRTFITDDLARAESYGGFLRIQYFAGAIPYIQGLLLYLLSCAFPFFAVFLVMPSRAESFFVWVSLWIWVKSWDIGFALVAVARKVMWLFVKHSVNQFGQNVDFARPESVFATITDNDPFATQSTYFAVVGLLTVSVPFLTAHLCLGATNLYDAFKFSIDQTANRLANFRTSWAKREVASRAEREYREAAHRHAMAAVQRMFGDGAGNGGMELFLRDGTPLSNRGDGSRAEMMAVAYMAAGVQFRWSEEGVQRAAKLGAATGRVVSQMGGSGKQLTDAYVRGLNMSFLGQNKSFGSSKEGGGHYVPTIPGITAPASPNPGISMPKKAGAVSEQGNQS